MLQMSWNYKIPLSYSIIYEIQERAWFDIIVLRWDQDWLLAISLLIFL